MMVEKAGAQLIHLDVMDGHFVPNITIGPLVVSAIKERTNLPLDVHLMIEKPEQYLRQFIDAGADYVTIHYETCTHLHRDIQSIKESGIKVGVAVNPHTPLCVLDDIIDELDLVLIMSVNPGFGGQRFIQNSISKIYQLSKTLEERNLEHIEIEVDGGVTLNNIKEISSAGSDIVVVGSAIYKSQNPTKIISQMNSILSI
ncbi:ribulose-phosphate 3-epimerase [Elysia marginata]|uniref:ribulose-phosphate 3-epimerase n=1 Tax=Elysia marginata TaxID=1093978 RepID=A0AAV4FPC2_9GAST|nr:ribulose-phosphate 3-epimerase [Elysia marginata]